MTSRYVKTSTLAVAAAVVLSGAAGCTGGGGSSSASSNGSASSSVVVDKSFDVKTLDPARQFEVTGSLVDHVLYQTLLTFKGGDVSKPVSNLASYTLSDGDKVMTLTMNSDAKFSDGAPVTVDDAVFSLQRVQGIAGNPSFLLQDVAIKKTSDKTLTLTSPQPNPTLPYILPSPSLGIVNAKAVMANGGTTDKADKAEGFLNRTSAGSGPYTLKSYDPTSQIVLQASPMYTGPKPAKSRIVLRNVISATQSLNIQSGDSQVALDLNPDQVKQLDAKSVNVQTAPSMDSVYLFLNQSPGVSKWTSNPQFVTAVKSALDYDKLLSLAGKGAVRTGGVVPSMLVGALPASQGLQNNLASAKQALKASGYNGEEVVFPYANDVTLDGLQFQPFAETIQAQLKAIGVNLKLAPGPNATEINNYRAGRNSMGIWAWSADFADPSDFLAFLPGQTLGHRAMWPKNADSTVETLGSKATSASGEEARSAAYQQLQIALNQTGPFIPLFQPVKNVATTKAIASVVPNAVWTLDLDSIR